uniref:Reverse transcriptase domain, reverse transcriptase zinc-binding domain protein n=1 Tax=Tanacetum cinerariifolium TaxID=118510 RepID=A0A6L2LAV8_TANCI|nr:reverse transcriptase domain, reverse transcriptase zinc-binding domain protein [Tanacetum cinerariifolium]
MKKGKAKVAWESVCMPKHDGGLEVMLVGDGASFSKLDPQSNLLFGIRLTMTNLHLLGSIDGLICVLLRTCFLIEILLDRVPLLLDDMDDVILWRDIDGVLWPFSKLKIQDRLRQWDVGPIINLNLFRYPLSDLVPDSHGHLFFEYAFSSQVWSKFCVLCSMDSIPPRIIDVTTFINPISKGKTAMSILSRLVLAATSYYIWLERNEILFKKKTLSPDHIVDVIISMVWLKLVTFKFKKMSTWSRLLLDQWKIPSYCIVYSRSSSEKHQNEKTSSPPPRTKTLSPPQAPSKSTSSKSTHYTSSSSLSAKRYEAFAIRVASGTSLHARKVLQFFLRPFTMGLEYVAIRKGNPNDLFMENYPSLKL